MPSFRGNVGNLLQHWVLCEILEACRGHTDQVDFVDAYSMAPLADERPKRDSTSYVFDLVREGLSSARTAYEQAWNELAPDPDLYPNSAAFLVRTWSSKYSLLLCESDAATASELRAWVEEVAQRRECVAAEVACGDWRTRFRQGISTSGNVTLFSFDPYMFDRHGSGRNPGNMDPTDLELIAATVDSMHDGVIVQLSTYSANNANPQDAVIDVVASGLRSSALELLGVVRADGNMMSMVFGRDVQLATCFTALPAQFETWLAAVKEPHARCSR